MQTPVRRWLWLRSFCSSVCANFSLSRWPWRLHRRLFPGRERAKKGRPYTDRDQTVRGRLHCLRPSVVLGVLLLKRSVQCEKDRRRNHLQRQPLKDVYTSEHWQWRSDVYTSEHRQLRCIIRQFQIRRRKSIVKMTTHIFAREGTKTDNRMMRYSVWVVSWGFRDRTGVSCLREKKVKRHEIRDMDGVFKMMNTRLCFLPLLDWQDVRELTRGDVDPKAGRVGVSPWVDHLWSHDTLHDSWSSPHPQPTLRQGCEGWLHTLGTRRLGVVNEPVYVR